MVVPKIHDVELVHIKHFRYLGVWFGYNKFRTRDKEIEHRLGCATGSFTANCYESKIPT